MLGPVEHRADIVARVAVSLLLCELGGGGGALARAAEEDDLLVGLGLGECELLGLSAGVPQVVCR